MNNLEIKSALKTYQVQFIDSSDGFFEQVDQLENPICVIDKNVSELHPAVYQRLHETMPTMVLEASESLKTWQGAESVLTFLQDHQANKQTTLLAIGGGIIQDISSFAAALYYRGIRFVLVPTTLLAAGDSCIGSKCGLNFKQFKNQIGMFFPPEVVLIWPEFFKTLSVADVQSGFGEIFKLALIGSESTYQIFKQYIAEHGFAIEPILSLIRQSLLVKKPYIEEDELDVGLRRILNFGHTFGHALESLTDYAIPHGIAVTWGIDAVNHIAYQMGYLDRTLFHDMHEFIQSSFELSSLENISADALIERTKRDKKVSRKGLNLVLLKRPGDLIIEPYPFDERLQGLLRNFIDDCWRK